MKYSREVIFSSILFWKLSRPQDVAIYGKISSSSTSLDRTEIGEITTKCFNGMGNQRCVSVIPTDDDVVRNELPYYKSYATNTGQLYCLQCCGTSTYHIDRWDMRCTLDFFTAFKSNLYGYEFRLARRKTTSELGYISCPLKRKQCSYDSNDNFISCDYTGEQFYLHGYILNVNVLQYHNNFDFWNGVSKCEATAIEYNTSLTSGDIFTESVILKYSPAPQKADTTYLFFLLFALFLVIYAALYFCRKKRCAVCQKKLVISKKRCYICIILGANPPDPRLLAALEDKGGRIQGEMPDLIPGSSPLIHGVNTAVRRVKVFILKSMR
jgi:hypothetical protein